jgi:hypothetical protein
MGGRKLRILRVTKMGEYRIWTQCNETHPTLFERWGRGRGEYNGESELVQGTPHAYMELSQ